MKKISALAVAALFSAVTPAIVFAQATPQTLAPGLDDNLTQSDQNVKGTDDQTQLTENISVTNFTEAVSVLDRANSVAIIHTSADQNGALALKPGDLDILRAHIQTSPKAMDALQGAGLTADQVVAIDAAGDGSVTLYVNG